MNNNVQLIGVTTGVLKVNHTFRGNNNQTITALETEVVYTSTQNVVNKIKVIFYKGSRYEKMLSLKDKKISIEGVLRTFNKNSWGKRINEVFLFPKSIKFVATEMKDKNVIVLKGKICGEVNLKKRTNGRYVCEAKLKVTREYGKFDYIPLVVFGLEAQFLNQLKHNDSIEIKGRIHSRTFNYHYEENDQEKIVKRTALEVCAHKLYKSDGRLSTNKQAVIPVLDTNVLLEYHNRKYNVKTTNHETKKQFNRA